MKSAQMFDGDDVLELFDPSESDRQQRDGGATEAPAPASFPVQRRWERIPIKLHIRVSRMVQGQEEVIDGQAQEISEGGIGAHIPGDYHMNERVSIEVVLPFGKQPFRFTAEVRDCRGFRYGFEFIDGKDGQREKLRDTLAAYATKKQ